MTHVHQKEREVRHADLPWAEREWVVCALHQLCVPLEPPLWPERLRIIPPYLHIPMNRIARDTQDSALREVLAAHRQTTFGSDAGQANTGGRMQPNGLVDDGLEIFEILSLFESRGGVIFISKSGIEFGMQFGLSSWIGSKVVGDGTRSADGRRANQCRGEYPLLDATEKED